MSWRKQCSQLDAGQEAIKHPPASQFRQKKNHETISSLSLRTAPFPGGLLYNEDLLSLSGGWPRLTREVPAQGKTVLLILPAITRYGSTKKANSPKIYSYVQLVDSSSLENLQRYSLFELTQTPSLWRGGKKTEIICTHSSSQILLTLNLHSFSSEKKKNNALTKIHTPA